MHDRGSVAVYSFGAFWLDGRRRLLFSSAGKSLRVSTKCFDALLHLVEHAGEVVLKADLMRAVWSGVCVEENSLAQCISTLRRVLGERPGDNEHIVTVPGRGYRFVAPVTADADESPGLRRRASTDVHAYQHYVTAWSALTRPGCRSLAHALEHLEQAVTIDPEFALAHACLAGCQALLGTFGLRAPHDVFPKARVSAQRALDIDASLAEAHTAMGHVHTVYDLDWQRARAAYQRALSIDPRSAMTHHYLGLQLLVHGDLAGALTHVRRAQTLEPLAANYSANIGMIHYYAGRYEAAVDQLRATLQLDESFDHARSFLGRALLRLGEFDRGIAEFSARTTATIGAAADLPVAYACCGRDVEARSALQELLESAAHRYVSPHDIAVIHAALGNTESTLDFLERSLDSRAQPINYLSLDPAFERVRSHPRFRDLVARLDA